jgi:hypothetical protein
MEIVYFFGIIGVVSFTGAFIMLWKERKQRLSH